jgi:NitT/TauT family transport system substrate-binding protein
MRVLRRIVALALLASALAAAGCGGQSPSGTTEIRIPLGAGGVGFLPLFVMRDRQLVEKHASAAGLADVTVHWIDLGGPAVMNDALLSGSVDFIAAGPPAFITLWDRTRGSPSPRSRCRSRRSTCRCTPRSATARPKHSVSIATPSP